MKTYANRSVTVSRFKFETSRILSNAEEIWAQTEKLCNKISNLEALNQVTRACSGERDRKTSTEAVSEDATQVNVMPTFILIGHGLGCWIIRHLIALHRHRTMVVNTVAVIFLDDLEIIQPGDQTRYTRFLERLKATFVNSRIAISERLASNLSTIDSNFQNARDYLQQKAPQHMECSHLKIWLQDQQPGYDTIVWIGMNAHIMRHCLLIH